MQLLLILFAALTSFGVHIHFYCQEQLYVIVSVLIKGHICIGSMTSCIVRTFQINYTFTWLCLALTALNGFSTASFSVPRYHTAADFQQSESYFPLRETYTELWYVSECYSPCTTLKGSLDKVSSMHYTGCTIEHCVPSQFQRPNLFYTSQDPSTLNQTGSDNKHQLFRASSLSVTH